MPRAVASSSAVAWDRAAGAGAHAALRGAARAGAVASSESGSLPRVVWLEVPRREALRVGRRSVSARSAASPAAFGGAAAASPAAGIDGLVLRAGFGGGARRRADSACGAGRRARVRLRSGSRLHPLRREPRPSDRRYPGFRAATRRRAGRYRCRVLAAGVLRSCRPRQRYAISHRTFSGAGARIPGSSSRTTVDPR